MPLTRLELTPDHTWDVRKWDDPGTEETGVEITLDPLDAVDHYWRHFWLPVVGPTCTILAAQLAAVAVVDPPEPLDAQLLSSSLGLGKVIGKHCSLGNALLRLEQFRIIRRSPDDSIIEARTHVRPLNPYQLGRLHPELQQAHNAWARMIYTRNADRRNPNADPKSPFLRRAAVG